MLVFHAMASLWDRLGEDLLAPERLVLWGPAVLGLVALVVFRPGAYERRARRRIDRRIARLGHAVIRNAVLADGVDGTTQIDYLLLTPTAIVVIALHRYQGVIFGGEGIDQWTQVVGHRSFKFDNPLYKNDADVTAVRALVPEAPVRGRVVFSDEGRFATALPAGVSTLAGLGEDLQLAPGAEGPAPALQEAWARLEVAAGRRR